MTTTRTIKQPFVIECSSCKMAFRTENLTPYLMAVREWYCPACGSQLVKVKSNYEDDRWYAMANSFSLNPTKDTVILLKDMYEIWDPSEFPLFKDFVTNMIREAADTVNDNDNNTQSRR